MKSLASIRTVLGVLAKSACLLALTSWIAAAAPFAYITNAASNSVSVIDIATNAVTATITVGANPTGVAVGFDGARVYITNTGNNSVSVIDTASNAVTSTISVGNGPGGVAVGTAGTRVYVANGVSNSVSVIDTASNTVVATVPVQNGPNGIAVNPAGTRAFVANTNSNSMSVIDTATNSVAATVIVGLRPFGLAVNRDGTRVYVTNDDSNTVSVIDATANGALTQIAVDDSPNGIAMSPDGTLVYVANFGSNTLSVIDAASNSLTATLGSGGVNPIGVTVTPDGARVYVANSTSGGVAAIDPVANTIASIAVGLQPTAFGQFIVGITPGAGTLQFSAASYSVHEGAGSAVITVTRRNGNEGEASANFATSDGSATAGGDYTATAATISFAAGETSRTVSIPIADDAAMEPAETIMLTLSNAVGATLGAQSTATLTITDNDTTTGSVFSGGGGCALYDPEANPGAGERRGIDGCLMLMMFAALLGLLRHRAADAKGYFRASLVSCFLNNGHKLKPFVLSLSKHEWPSTGSEPAPDLIRGRTEIYGFYLWNGTLACRRPR
ncbi:MAG: beta-propeller fold lactonase family protein [Burkholderiales bacterium]|nr:beta-propeller fold lactonase family protein [Burkholderiales bacterium]